MGDVKRPPRREVTLIGREGIVRSEGGRGASALLRKMGGHGLCQRRLSLSLLLVVRHPALSLLVIGCLAMAALGCSPSRVIEAGQVLTDIQAGPGPSALKEATEPPLRLPISFEIEGRLVEADLYLPAEGARAAMVMVPGVAPTGRNDARLVAFATTMARSRFEVLVPDLPRMRALQVSGEDARILADAAIYLDRRGPTRPLGMTAISFAAGPAVGALFEPGVDGRVDFLLTIGGYYDIEAVITFFTTGYFREKPSAPWQYRTPNRYGKWVFVLSNAPRLDDAADREALTEMALRRLDNPTTDIADLVDRLGPDGRSIYDLLANGDPNRAESLIAALPASVLAEAESLDIQRRDLSGLATRFLLIHGYDDSMIPETESMAFARAVAPGRARLYLLDSLDHVNPREPGLVDSVRLLDAVYDVLSLRDGERIVH